MKKNIQHISYTVLENDFLIHDHEYLEKVNEEKEGKKAEVKTGKVVPQEINKIPGIGISPIGFIAAKELQDMQLHKRSLIFPFSLTEQPFWGFQSLRRRRNPETSAG